MILMGNLPQASSSIEDVTDESPEESRIIKIPKEGNLLCIAVLLFAGSQMFRY